jgi:hypothetical protein
LAANSQKKLDKFRDVKISSVMIVRTPIFKAINKLADFLTKGKFTKDMLANGYDDMFHLAVIVKLENGVHLKIEKNETVEISRVPGFPPKDIQQRKVYLRKTPPTLGEAWKNFEGSYPNKRVMYNYDSLKNNCQRAIDNFLSSNQRYWYYDKQDKAFVKQDVKFIADNYPKLAKGAKAITDLAQRLTLFKWYG